MIEFNHITLAAYVKCPHCENLTCFNIEVTGEFPSSTLESCEHCDKAFAATHTINLIVIAEPVVANGNTTTLDAATKPKDYKAKQLGGGYGR